MEHDAAAQGVGGSLQMDLPSQSTGGAGHLVFPLTRLVGMFDHRPLPHPLKPTGFKSDMIS